MYIDIPAIEYMASASFYYSAPYISEGELIENSTTSSPFLTKEEYEKEQSDLLQKKYDEYKEKIIGKRIDVDGFPRNGKFQCVDPIKDYAEFLGLDTSFAGNAIDFAGSGSIGKDFQWFKNDGTNKPQKGDVLVFGKHYGRYGHVGLASECYDDGTCLVLEQNGATGYGNGKNGNQMSERVRSLNGAIGWQRPILLTTQK